MTREGVDICRYLAIYAREEARYHTMLLSEYLDTGDVMYGVSRLGCWPGLVTVPRRFLCCCRDRYI